MNEYKASNGVALVRSETGHIILPPVTTGLGEDTQQALREFFQHERDEELGRWRWPENPDYVVYPLPDDAFDRRRAEVFNERTNERTVFNPVVATGQSEKNRAARAYFEAHPGPKPWHDAKPGEVWVVKEQGQPERAYLVDDSQFYDSSRDYALYFEDSVILEARRVWPEVS